MSDTIQDDWNEMVEEMNEAVADSMEQNMEAQAAFVESWADAVEDSIPGEDEMSEGLQGYNRAYEEWVDAAEQMVERSTASPRANAPTNTPTSPAILSRNGRGTKKFPTSIPVPRTSSA